MTHGADATYPRLADVIGFCTTAQVIAVAENVVKVQRDFGDRRERKHARLKYTIEDHGVAWFKARLEEYLGFPLGATRPYHFEDNGDRYGWVEDERGHAHLTLFIEGGRVVDTDNYPLRTGLREIAKIHQGDFRLTANQNVIIADVAPANRAAIEALLETYKLRDSHLRSALRLNSLACVALPTCGLALAESERYLPHLVTELEELMERHGLRHDAITIRMTGCPNGCGRPYIAEIGFVGRAPNKYNVYLGGGFAGQRLNKLYRAAVAGEEIAGLLAPLIEDYAKRREPGERFGDFVIRVGHIMETKAGNEFHADVAAEELAAVGEA
jgi:sulfite reductase (NADPH) hemoprotein beta-component